MKKTVRNTQPTDEKTVRNTQQTHGKTVRNTQPTHENTVRNMQPIHGNLEQKITKLFVCLCYFYQGLQISTCAMSYTCICNMACILK